MPIEQVVTDCRVRPSKDVDCTGLRLRLSGLHHYVREVVVEVVILDLDALPGLVEIYDCLLVCPFR